jgi:SAM-dependent methyltransferase
MHTLLIGFLMLLQPAPVPDTAQNSSKRRTAAPVLPGETPVQYWDRAYADANLAIPTTPNGFLVEAVRKLKPGRALDIGIGQGRNSVYLAKQGWEVTGFDISEKGMELAQMSAARLGVKLTTVKASMEQFDFGLEQWDLIVATYQGVSWLKAAARGLKPGGCIVVEGYGKHPDAPPTAAFGPNELPRLFIDQKLEIIRYEDTEAEPDWLKLDRVVRMFARKPG